MNADSEKSKKHKWGSARVQFAAAADEIKKLLDEEYPKRTIYNNLFSSGKITMSYCRFCQFIDIKFMQKYTNKRSGDFKKNNNGKTNQNQISLIGVKKDTHKIIDMDTSKDAKPFGQRDKSQPYNTNI